MECDFCSAPNPVAWFDIEPGGVVRTIVMGADGVHTFEHVDDGKWAACEACRDEILTVADLVRRLEGGRCDAMDIEKLAEAASDVACRSLEHFIARDPTFPMGIAAASISDMHSLFWMRYTRTEPHEITDDERVA